MNSLKAILKAEAVNKFVTQIIYVKFFPKFSPLVQVLTRIGKLIRLLSTKYSRKPHKFKVNVVIIEILGNQPIP